MGSTVTFNGTGVHIKCHGREFNGGTSLVTIQLFMEQWDVNTDKIPIFGDK